MYVKFIVILGLVGLAVAGVKPIKDARKTRGYAPGYGDAALGDYTLVSDYVQPIGRADSQPAPSHHGLPAKPGFSVGGGLVSIARGSADQARTALGNQHSAAGQAAYVAKNQLAQSAAQSAATANAAFAGKQIIFLGLQQQSADARNAIDGEKRQLEQAARAAQAARNAAQQAMHQVQVITAALNAAQATQDHASQAAAEAAAELAAQTTMLGQAKARAQTIDEQLDAARIDFEATQSARDKAQAAAQQAQNNAAAAAAQAAESAAANHPGLTVAEEEDGHSALPALPAKIQPDSHEEIVQHDAYLPPTQYEDVDHEQTLLIHRNSLQSAPHALFQAHQGIADSADEYDYKGYY
ncbi:coiled-coil domain-containing protein 8 homolog [Fopius arisanus]|uniref:Coiled-coil domain-containing protein 8 homolog n=1 Tax=Fopius arisanus TaxID=64838 RepID=A0A0C9Q4P1_9HYME|nr:PREDICTED: coiled-coil domain-containing protein 8 homolog [Fopius arisanus]